MQINIEDEMKKSFIDYAMSVIVQRALPDVRDGLKPVHRRILYAMHDLGFTPDKPHRKSATTVGEVLGKYHPHGDAAVYDTMVRMAQDFSHRYMLIDGHGNFGSVDGDSPAAMRYTEARMAKISMEMMRDINKETVDFIPNYDESLKEPSVLPSRFPNLLVNGSNGIAVGMATSIPPHNLNEVIDGVIASIDDPDIELDELMKHIKAPDFPTGGLIMGREGVKKAYATGRGRVIVRAKAEIEAMSSNRQRIVVYEIPYQVNKANLIEKIADLVKDKRIEGISDLRDESDREGMRIVIELKRDANANVVLNLLYKHTQLQDTFSIIMLALDRGQPRVMDLKTMINHYIAHQKEIIIRRTQYDLRKAEERAHILEGLRIALDNIDEIINILRSSKTVPEAKERMMERFGLSDAQATAIAEMRLKSLTGLERGKIEEEYLSLIKDIEYYNSILASELMVSNIVKNELLEIKKVYGDKRRSKITQSAEEFNEEDLIDEQEVAVTLTHYGYIKRLPADTYKSQRRGGRGITALQTREDDFVEHLFITSTHNYLLFFTNKGRMYRLKTYEIPEAGRQAKGTALVNLLHLDGDEKVSAVIPIKGFEDEGYLIFMTKKGTIKKTELKQYASQRVTGLNAITLRDEDELISVKLTRGTSELMAITRHGLSIRFPESDVRDMGRSAMGVKGVTLNPDDSVIALDIVEENAELLVISEKGFGKRTPLSEYRVQSRGGKGIKTSNITGKTGYLVGAKVVKDDCEVMLISAEGIIIRMAIDGISVMGRSTQGVTLMKLAENDSVVALAKIVPDEEC
ncbi:DNA gyrase subunit A [Lutispora saccharofermentans]|uniref:DNA gyrase subunit A n=1 Tax=Lutispora saccharofermentans TaxID=3024236 RepID=A0ABT1NKJ1_9FIRM|nr:DNA gyrase subunit A [Lutispora saccharofermentans]MCQ1531697.1 DNA gyrase subunit A [Lutispora saccharofermentans]